MIEPRLTATVVDGLLSVMRHLRIIEGAPSPAKQPWFIQQRVNLTSEHDGMFYPLAQAGWYVTPGTLLGYVTDFHGRRLQEITATEPGPLLTIIATPPVKKGETIAVIASTMTRAAGSPPQ
jgi:predicted deacylase